MGDDQLRWRQPGIHGPEPAPKHVPDLRGVVQGEVEEQALGEVAEGVLGHLAEDGQGPLHACAEAGLGVVPGSPALVPGRAAESIEGGNQGHEHDGLLDGRPIID